MYLAYRRIQRLTCSDICNMSARFLILTDGLTERTVSFEFQYSAQWLSYSNRVYLYATAKHQRVRYSRVRYSSIRFLKAICRNTRMNVEAGGQEAARKLGIVMTQEHIKGNSSSKRQALIGQPWIRIGIMFALCALVGFAFPLTTRAQLSKILQSRGFQGPPQGGATAQNSKVLPAELKNVGISQELNHQVPLDLVFHDETGKTVRLGDYFGKRPVILSLVYFNCPRLCPMVEDGLVEGLRELPFDVGKQFNVLTVSFDPRDTPFEAYAKRAMYLNMYNRKGAAAGWHFLTGDQASITALTKAVGFRYNYDPRNGQYYHATAIMILTPQGKVAQYFYGIRYPAGQLRLALVQASNGKIGSPVDAILLFCCRYDPATGKYSLIITRVLFIAGLLTVILLGVFLIVLFRGGRNAQARVLATQTSAKAER